MNNGQWQDLGPKKTVGYREAIEWIVVNDNLRWLEAGQLSRAASAIADLFGRSPDTLRDDIKAKLQQTNTAQKETA